MKKVVLLTNGIFPFSIGGMQKHSYFLAKYFSKNRVFVEVYFPKVKEKKNEVENVFEKEELRFITFKEVELPDVKRFPGHYIYTWYKISKSMYKSIDFSSECKIYAQGFTSWYTLIKRPYCNQLVANLHGLEMYQHTINFKNSLEQLLLRIPANLIVKKSNKQISLGGKLTQILYKHKAKKNSVCEIPNGIDKSWIADENIISNFNETNRQIKFVFVGRYERRKGIEEFNNVISSTIENLNYSVNFVGPIPEEKQLKYTNINYIGAVKVESKIRDILIDSDILVCPSYSEGMPTVILEAMACGCAIIATDVGATSMLVDHKNGWIIDNKNIEKNLKKSIYDAMNMTSKELNIKKNNSISKVKDNFTWDKVIEKTLNLLDFETSI